MNDYFLIIRPDMYHADLAALTQKAAGRDKTDLRENPPRIVAVQTRHEGFFATEIFFWWDDIEAYVRMWFPGGTVMTQELGRENALLTYTLGFPLANVMGMSKYYHLKENPALLEKYPAVRKFFEATREKLAGTSAE